MYRILQIEDLPSDAYLVRREVSRVLNDACEFQIVEDREAFETALSEFNPDLIISDFSIPGFDWQTALRLVTEKDLGTPFFVVSGSISEDIRKECIAAGATEFICKDNIAKLGPAVKKALKK